MNPKHAPPIHTTPPWIPSENHPTDIIDAKGDFIARCLRSENAAFIVRAVNSHDELLSALQQIGYKALTLPEIVQMARDVLAKVEAKS